MPVYDFLCNACGKEFALTLHLAEYDKHDVACPSCQSRRVERVVASFEVVTSKKS
jgi:putative FmdB family regulatory protein